MYDELTDNITFKNVVILMTCVIKDGDKCYPQLFLEEALFLLYKCNEKIMLKKNIGLQKRIE